MFLIILLIILTLQSNHKLLEINIKNILLIKVVKLDINYFLYIL